MSILFDEKTFLSSIKVFGFYSYSFIFRFYWYFKVITSPFQIYSILIKISIFWNYNRIEDFLFKILKTLLNNF